MWLGIGILSQPRNVIRGMLPRNTLRSLRATGDKHGEINMGVRVVRGCPGSARVVRVVMG